MAYDGSSPEAKELLKEKPVHVGIDLAVVKGPKDEVLFSVTDFKNSYTTIGPIESFPDIKESLLAMQVIQHMQKKVYKELFEGLPSHTTGRYSSSDLKRQKEADDTIQARLDRKRVPVSRETDVIHHAILTLSMRKNSWCQGAVENHMGQLCLMGAAEKATQDKELLRKINTKVGRQARHRYGGPWNAGHHFNDDPGTNKSMVLHVLLDTFESLGGQYA